MGKSLHSVWACVLAVVLFCGAPVSAQLTKEQFLCQNTVAKQGKRLFSKVFKNLAKCEDKVSNGELPANTDCNLEPDAGEDISKAVDRFTAKLQDKCPNAAVAALDFGGACLGVTTATDLATCAAAEHDAAARRLIELVYPRRVCVNGAKNGAACATDSDCPVGGVCTAVNTPLNEGQQECQTLLAKTVLKQAGKRLSTLQSCKKRIGKNRLPAETDCVANKQEKLDKLLAASRATIDAVCPDLVTATLRFADACAAQTDTDAVEFCALCVDDQEADDLITVQYGSSPYGATAVARQITDTADCVGGPLSRCRVNDYLMANDKIRVVIQDLQRNMLSIGQFGGQIIDADHVRAVGDPDRDNFEEWSVSVNVENTAHYTSIAVVNDGSNGGPAIIRATGVDDLLDFINPSSVIADFGFTFPATADDTDLDVAISTDYILEPGKNYVRVETMVLNVGTAQYDLFFGDFLNGSGQLKIFQPNYGFGEPLATLPCSATPANNTCLKLEAERNFVAYEGYDAAEGVSYGYVHNVPNSTAFTTSGVTVPQLGISVVAALTGNADAPFVLQPMGDAGDSLTFTRHFVVGTSVSSVTDTRNQIQCLPTGRLEGTITSGSGPAVGANVSIIDDDATAAPSGLLGSVVTSARTDDQGRYAMTLTPGTYFAVANLDGSPYEGGGGFPAFHLVAISPFGTTVQDMALPATGALQVLVTDPGMNDLPAKVSVVGHDPSPYFANNQNVAGIFINRAGVFDDLEDDFPFGIARTFFVGPSGDSGVVRIEPGSYQVVVSRGPEYSIYTENVVVAAAPAAPTVVTAEIERVIDTTGFIAADFHVHSIQSPDSAVKQTERVLSMLAEGVDFFTPSEHDNRFDYLPTVNAVGAASLISIAPSSEITTFDYGHFNAWPMTIDPSQVNGGTVDHGGAAPAGEDFPTPYNNYNLTPADVILAAHNDPGTDTVQINHIHSHFGLDGGSGLGIDTGLEPPQSSVTGAARRLDPLVSNYFTDTFDALEIWIGDNRSQIFNNFLGITDPGTAIAATRGGNIGDWFNMINQGIGRTGIADSDTHSRFRTQAGIPRSMVASSTDDPAALGAIAETLSQNVNDGRVVGTNGPMVRVTAHAASTGQSGGLDLGRCTGVVPCTSVADCPPCIDDTPCAVGESCTPLPTTISTNDGEVDITVDIQSPTWAPFDRVEYYIKTTTTQRTLAGLLTGDGTIDLKRYVPAPDDAQDAPGDFTVSTEPVGSSSRLEASTTLQLTGLTEDTWVVVVVKGTDNVSEPLFPVVPNDLQTAGNGTLVDLTDGNLNELGINALAFTNPIRIDVDGGGWSPPGVQIIIP